LISERDGFCAIGDEAWRVGYPDPLTLDAGVRLTHVWPAVVMALRL